MSFLVTTIILLQRQVLRRFLLIQCCPRQQLASPEASKLEEVNYSHIGPICQENGPSSPFVLHKNRKLAGVNVCYCVLLIFLLFYYSVMIIIIINFFNNLP